jgi:hypothetical protein
MLIVNELRDNPDELGMKLTTFSQTLENSPLSHPISQEDQDCFYVDAQWIKGKSGWVRDEIDNCLPVNFFVNFFFVFAVRLQLDFALHTFFSAT